MILTIMMMHSTAPLAPRGGSLAPFVAVSAFSSGNRPNKTNGWGGLRNSIENHVRDLYECGTIDEAVCTEAHMRLQHDPQTAVEIDKFSKPDIHSSCDVRTLLVVPASRTAGRQVSSAVVVSVVPSSYDSMSSCDKPQLQWDPWSRESRHCRPIQYYYHCS